MNGWLILIWIMAILYGALILIYRSGWQKLPVEYYLDDNHINVPVTVIVPARNEADNIISCLQSVAAQHYPENLLEIIVVNDHSTDNTAEFVSAFPAKNIRLVHLSDHIKADEKLIAHKKRAIEIAIGEAAGELIITTDADCTMGPDWVKTIVQCYVKEHPVLIAAPVAFHHENSFFTSFQSLDFMTMQGITGATIRYNMGTMCNGANLAYSKKAFNEVGGFLGIDCIASGDDMLLMYKMYRAYPDRIRFLKNKAAIVYTLPMATLRDFIQQRIRWSSKAKQYDDKRLTGVLAFVYCWNLLFPILIIAGFFHPVYWLLFLILLIYKTIIELYFLFPVANFFGKRKMLGQFFASQFLHIPYIIIAGWLGVFSKYNWKGRQVK